MNTGFTKDPVTGFCNVFSTLVVTPELPQSSRGRREREEGDVSMFVVVWARVRQAQRIVPGEHDVTRALKRALCRLDCLRIRLRGDGFLFLFSFLT